MQGITRGPWDIILPHFQGIDWLRVYRRSCHLTPSFSDLEKAVEKAAVMSTHGRHAEVVSIKGLLSFFFIFQ